MTSSALTTGCLGGWIAEAFAPGVPLETRTAPTSGGRRRAGADYLFGSWTADSKQ